MENVKSNDNANKQKPKAIKNFKELTYDEFECYIDMCLQNPNEKQLEFFKDMYELITTDKDSKKITCIPARCGIGKSSFIKALMMVCTHGLFYDIRKEPIGLIVLTDSIQRLESYGDINSDNENKWIIDFYKEFTDKIIVLKSDEPFKKQLEEQSYKPILLMSTQRYFMLDDDIRELLFTFYNNKKRYARNRVIFDERPYFSEYIDLSIENLNQIDTALKMGLDDTVINKNWAISEFEEFSKYLQNIMHQKELIRDKSIYLFWRNQRKNITCDDEKFFNLIKENRDMAKKYNNCYRDLLNFKVLLDEGGIFYCQKKKDGGKYNKGFILLKNNVECFYLGKKKAKFFVFDATCNIDPVYDLNYVNIVNCDKYNVPLNMKITNVCVPTTKNALCNSKKSSQVMTTAIQKYLESKAKLGFKHDMLIVTYQEILKRFSKSFKYYGYFGNMKGYNTFRDKFKMGQIGFNRYTDLAYYLIFCSCNPEAYEILKTKTEAETIEWFDLLFKNGSDSSKLREIMYRSIIADFEQNIFRTAIRNYDNTQLVNIWTFCNISSQTYKELFKKLEDRYKPLGVTFEYETDAIEIKTEKVKMRCAPNDKNSNNTQIVLKWTESQEIGRKFKTADVLKETGLNNQQFQKTKECLPIRTFFNTYKTNKNGFYEIV